MKITRIDTHLTELANRSIPYVVVHTDEGIHGVGEPFSCGPDGATVAAIHDYRRMAYRPRSRATSKDSIISCTQAAASLAAQSSTPPSAASNTPCGTSPERPQAFPSTDS